MSNNQPTTFYIVRHGESEYNLKKLVQGSGTGDTTLTEKGKKQASEVAEMLNQINFDAIFSSHLKRALQTAEIIARTKNLSVQTDERLRERSQGKYENMPMEEFLNFYTENNWGILSNKEKFEHKLHESQENFKESNERFKDALSDLAKKHPGQTILIVTHGNLIRGLLIEQNYGDFDKVGGIVNCGYVEVESDGKNVTIKNVIGLKTWKESQPQKK
jgi:probable phosphoglycerate mutase